ncbi:major facilitator superfamily domain-containing protein 6-like [Ornithodoros turicata]
MDDDGQVTRHCMDFRVNTERLRTKINFFLLYSVGAIILPTLPVFGRQLGLNAASVTMVLTVVPFVIFVARPVVGGIADRLQKLSFVLAIVLIIEMVGIILLTIVPPITHAIEPNTTISVELQSDRGVVVGAFRGSPNTSCVLRFLTNTSTHCHIACPCATQLNASLHSNYSTCEKEISLEARFQPLDNVTAVPSSFVLSYNDSALIPASDIPSLEVTAVTCSAACSVDTGVCFPKDVISAKSSDVVMSYQLCAFFVLLSLVRVCASSSYSLSDAACFEVLGECPQDYCMQRMWGTIGWGIMAPLCGLLIDIVNKDSVSTDYTVGFYLAAGLLMLQAIVCWKWKLHKTKSNRNILKNVGSLVRRPKNFCFLLDIFVVGACSSVHWFFMYWYLQDLGATKLLMGLALATQSFLGDLPFMFLAKWMLSKMKNINVIRLAYVGFFLKFLGYSFLTNPWWAIAIELLQGPTYGSFYVAMTSYAQSISPPGTEATFQSVVSSVFDCLGVAAGSFLGGMGFAYVGGRKTYFIASIVPVVWLICTLVCDFFINECTASDNNLREEIELNSPASQPFISSKERGHTGQEPTQEA